MVVCALGSVQLCEMIYLHDFFSLCLMLVRLNIKGNPPQACISATFSWSGGLTHACAPGYVAPVASRKAVCRDAGAVLIQGFHAESCLRLGVKTPKTELSLLILQWRAHWPERCWMNPRRS